jgi:hypothetical protein
MLVAVAIFLVVAFLTIGTINLGATTERVRSAARIVQSKIEGARDRAIYNSRNAGEPRAVGIRLLVDDTEPTICTSIVYVESPGTVSAPLDTTDLNMNGIRDEATSFFETFNETDLLPFVTPPTEFKTRALVGNGMAPPLPRQPSPDLATLYERRLIGPGSRITVGSDLSTAGEFVIHPRSFPVRTEGDHGFPDLNGNGRPDSMIFLIQSPPEQPSAGSMMASVPLQYTLALGPDVMAGEEPVALPRGMCIDLETSHLPDSWVVRTPAGVQFSEQMDILFTAQGPVTGSASAAGIIHLHISTIADAQQNAQPGSPTVWNDLDGDGALDAPQELVPRNGDELGITIFTRSGRVIVHPMNFAGYLIPEDILPQGSSGWTFDDTADFDMTPQTKGYWQPSTNYSPGDRVAPRNYNGLIYVVVGGTGSSGSSEPVWDIAPGGITVDGGIRWRGVKHNVWALGLEGEVAK